ncbi:hypothetical protein QBC36DRAFT_377937 [Triangularia setosa]|uniref:Uncharacterized protein n=1 Tax=Triangularia setosa TaxID=2587417 RepID=A0AAN6W8F3_9PEZI|nr:hypothetical protein QBC36DRAFT_377937 [Podospora setosa]
MQITNSVFALCDFARCFTADCRPGSDESTLLVKLASKRVVNVMANNGDVIKRRMDEIKSAREWVEESTNSGSSRHTKGRRLLSHHHGGSSGDPVQKPGRKEEKGERD